MALKIPGAVLTTEGDLLNYLLLFKIIMKLNIFEIANKLNSNKLKDKRNFNANDDDGMQMETSIR